MMPDTVAIVAWTVDTNLKWRERKWVTPTVTPGEAGGRAMALVAPAELPALWHPHHAHPNSLAMAWDVAKAAVPALPPGDTAGVCFQVSSLPRPWMSGNPAPFPAGRAAPKHHHCSNGY